MDRQQLRQLMETRMDRRDFLRYVFILIASMVGIGKLIGFLKRPLARLGGNTKIRSSGGYGSSPYGK